MSKLKSYDVCVNEERYLIYSINAQSPECAKELAQILRKAGRPPDHEESKELRVVVVGRE